MASITPKNGRVAFLVDQDPSTYFELNSTNLGANYGRDPASSDISLTGSDISTQESYEGMDNTNNPPTGTLLDNDLINDAAVLLYIPAGLAHGTVRGIFHNGGGTNGQGLMIRATTTGVEIACGHNNGGGTTQDNVIEEIPDADLPGWFCISCQYNSHGGTEGDMALWLNGTAVRSGTRVNTLDWGSGNPQVGDANHAEPDAADCLDPSSYSGGDWGTDNTINGTGILIANYTADNPSDGASDTSPGNGDDFHTDYYDAHVETAGTINEETLQDLTSVAVTDDTVELRQRYREQSDTEISALVTDNLFGQYIPPGTGPISRATRYRNHTELDSLETADDKTATYTQGQQISNIVLQDLDSVLVGDFIAPLRLRDREQADSAELLDTIDPLRLRDRGQSDAIDVEDVNAQWIESNEELTESIDTTDDAVESRERNRVASDSIDVGDEIEATYVPGLGAIVERTLQDLDSVTTIDATIELRLRDRGQSDSIDVEDIASSWIQNEYGQTETIDTTDDSVEQRERNRVASDSIAATDAIDATYVPGDAAVTSRTLSDAIEVDDVSSRWLENNEQQTEVIDANDDSLEARERNRQASDAIDVTDGLTHSAAIPKLLSDSIDVTDSIQGIREARRDLQDDFVLTDLAIAIREARRGLTQSLDATDSTIELRWRDRLTLDPIVLTDTMIGANSADGPQSRATRTRNRQDATSIDVADTSLDYATRNREPADSISATDASIQLRNRSRVPSDSIDVEDVSTGIRNVEGEIIEVIDTTDDSTELRTRNRQATESIDVEDTVIPTYVSTATVTARTLSDALAVTDNAIILRERNRQSADNAPATDAIAASRLRPRQQTDSLDLSETIETVRHRLREITDDTEITDTVIVTTDLGITYVTLADQLAVTDSIDAEFVRGLPEFYVYHDVERLSVESEVERFNILHNVRQETS